MCTHVATLFWPKIQQTLSHNIGRISIDISENITLLVKTWKTNANTINPNKIGNLQKWHSHKGQVSTAQTHCQGIVYRGKYHRVLYATEIWRQQTSCNIKQCFNDLILFIMYNNKKFCFTWEFMFGNSTTKISSLCDKRIFFN